MLARKVVHRGLLVGGLLVALGADARAQTYPQCDRQPTADDVEGAKGAHKAAQRFYDKGQYEEAIRSWTDAYKFDCTAHPLLINIGNAYEKMGERPKAIAAFETYLQRVGQNADPTIPDKVANLKVQLEREQAKPVPTTAPTATETRLPPPPPPPPGNEAGSGGPGVGPWILVGAGGVAIVVGAIVLGVGLSDISAAEVECPARVGCSPEVESQGNRGRIEAPVGGVVGGVGIVAAAAGLIWYFVAKDDGGGEAATASVSVQPTVGPWMTGLSLSGAF